MSEYFAQEQWVAAQQSVIGSMLLDKGWVPEVLAQTRAEDYTQPYRALYLAIQQLTQEGTAIDAVTVLHALDGDAAENRKLVLDLLDLTPTAANCKAYMDILLDQAQLSRLRGLGLALAECQTGDAAREAAASIGEALAVRSTQETFTQQDLLGRFYERHDTKKPVRYLPWGIKKLDMRLYAELGDFVILGGYPSDGKTALALSFAWAQSEQYRVGFFSLETRADKLFDRQMAMVAGLPMERIKRHQLSDEDWQAMAHNGQTVYDRHLDILPAAGRTAAEVMNLAKAKNYQIIYIDYIQLLKAENPRATRYEQVSQTSMTLHTLANQYGITVVGLSQLSRPQKDRAQVKPSMSDLRESGQLEQDADIVLLLYRLYPNDGSKPDRDLKIAKNKAGANIFASVDVSAVDVNLLDTLYFAYGADTEVAGSARLLLTKEDLKAIGQLRGTNEKRRLFTIEPDMANPNVGVIRDGGVVIPYTICPDLTSLSTATASTSAAIQTMIYGNPLNYELGLFSDFTVRVDESYKAQERLLTILGDVMVGGNLVVDKGVVVATLPKSGS